jgi:hypothetical protein
VKKFNIFISCSFRDEHNAVVNYASNIIKSLGFSPLLLKSAEGKQIPEKIKENIKICDVFLLLVLEDLSDYILNEIGIAFALDKRIIVLHDKKVEMKGGILSNLTDYIIYDRSYYWEFTPELIVLLNRASQQLIPTHIDKDYIIRKLVMCRITLTLEEIVTQTEIESINLSGELREVNHGLILYDDFEMDIAVSLEFLFKMIHPSSLDYVLNSWEARNAKNFKVCFSEPIMEMQKFKYMYEQKLTNYFPMNNKEIYRRLASGRYHLTDAFAEKCYTVSTPTEKLLLELIFPESLRISECRVVVTYYKGDNRNREEEKRLEKDGALSHLQEYSKEKIVLKVDYPKTFMKYSLQWRYS